MTEKITKKEPNTGCNSIKIKIGKTTYIVVAKQAESAKKSAETVFRDMCRHEVMGDLFNVEKSVF